MADEAQPGTKPVTFSAEVVEAYGRPVGEALCEAAGLDPTTPLGTALAGQPIAQWRFALREAYRHGHLPPHLDGARARATLEAIVAAARAEQRAYCTALMNGETGEAVTRQRREHPAQVALQHIAEAVLARLAAPHG